MAEVVAEAQLPVAAAPRCPAALPEEPEHPALGPPVLARVPVLASWQVAVGLAPLLVVVRPVVEAAAPLDLLSRRSSSAAMARSTPSPGAPMFEPVRRSR